MFKDVTNASGLQVEDGKYIGKLVALEDGGESTFKEGERRVIWKFQLADYGSKQVVLNPDGATPHEFWAFTSDNMGKKSTARKYVEALLARELKPGEKGAELAGQIVGKYATLIIAKNENERAVIMAASPYTVNGTNGQAPEPKPEPPANNPNDMF